MTTAARVRVSPSGPYEDFPAEPGPLSDFWWVDAASTAGAEADGSEARPYATIDAAIAAAAALLLTRVTLVLAPGVYAAAAIDSEAGGFVQLVLSTPNWATEDGTPSVEIASITWTPQSSGASQLVLLGLSVTGNVTISDAGGAGRLIMQSSYVGGYVFSTTTTTAFRGVDTNINLSLTTNRTELRHCTIGGVLSAFGGLRAWDSDFPLATVTGTFPQNESYLVNCKLSDPGGGGTALDGDTQVNQWIGCLFLSNAMLFNMTAPGVVQMDGVTNYAYINTNAGLTNGTRLVIDNVVAIPPVVTGSRDGNAALESLLTALAALEIIDDQTTA